MDWFLGTVTGAIFGAAVIANFADTHFVNMYSDKPYCEEVSIGDRNYKRCWKAVEVAP